MLLLPWSTSAGVARPTSWGAKYCAPNLSQSCAFFGQFARRKSVKRAFFGPSRAPAMYHLSDSRRSLRLGCEHRPCRCALGARRWNALPAFAGSSLVRYSVCGLPHLPRSLARIRRRPAASASSPVSLGCRPYRTEHFSFSRWYCAPGFWQSKSDTQPLFSNPSTPLL
jgi:hypothetical protein